jgi:hypothetical protein
MNNARIVYDILRKEGGYSHAQTMGVMGNLFGESGDRGDINTRGFNAKEGAYGVAQWRLERLDNLKSFSAKQGLDYSDPRAQARFIIHELNTSEKLAGRLLSQARTAEEAAGAFLAFERPAGWTKANPSYAPDLARRVRLARQYEGKLLGAASPAFDDSGLDDADPTASLRDTLNARQAGYGDQVIKDNPFLSKYPTVGAYQEWKKVQTAEASRVSDLGMGETMPSTSGDIRTPSVRSNLEQAQYDEDIEKANEAKYGRAWYEDAWDAMSQQPSIRDTGRLLTASGFAEDPSYRQTPEELKRLTDGLPEQYWDRFQDARSQDHANYIRQELDTELERYKKYASGGTAYALGMGLIEGTFDVPSLALGLGIGKVASIGAATRNSMIAREAAGGVAGAILSEVPSQLGNPMAETSDLAIAAGLGLVLGAGSGAFSSRALQQEAQALEDIGRRIAGLPTAGRSGDAGAAYADGIAPLNGSASDWVQADRDIGGTTFGNARLDASATLQKSDNPVTRALGQVLVEDPVGFKNGPQLPALTEWQGKLFRTWNSRATDGFDAIYNDYAKANNLGWFEKSQGRQAFEADVLDTLRGGRAIDEVDPHIKKAADLYRNLYREIAETAQNPGILNGTTRRSVNGFEDGFDNPNYVPRIVDRASVAVNLDKYGTRQIEDLFEAAIRNFTPDLEEGVARKVAKGYVKTLHSLKAGTEGGAARTLQGGDMAALRELMEDIDGVTPEDINKVMAAMAKRDSSDAGKVSRAKRRTPLDENFSMEVKNRKTGQMEVLKVASFFESNPQALFLQYNRTMSAQIALAMARVKNPRYQAGTVKKVEEYTKVVDGQLVKDTREVEVPASVDVPEYLIDGITSRGEWETLMKRVKEVGDEMNPLEVDAGATDVDRLNTVYGLLIGGPVGNKFNPIGNQWARRLREWNFIRLMNNMGIAQIPEFGNVMGTMGVKATLGAIPWARKLTMDAKKGRLDPEFLKEIDGILAPGYEHRMPLGIERTFGEDPGVVVSSGSKFGRKFDEFTTEAKDVTSTISFFKYIDTALQNVAARAYMQKITDTVFRTGARFSPERLESFGLDAEMWKRVEEQAKKHATFVQGAVSGRNIKTLGLDQWDDVEAKAALEMSAYRATRRVVQQNDIGSVPLWMQGDTWKLLMQFRSFVVGAYGKQTLHSLKMRDSEALSAFLLSSFLGGLTHTIKRGIRYNLLKEAGEDDKAEKEWEKSMSWTGIAAGAFGNTGQGSIIPMGIDMALGLIGEDKLFDGNRASGLASGFITGNPSISMLDGLGRSIGALGQNILRDDPITKGEFRTMLQQVPFLNNYGAMSLFGGIINDLPDKNPAKSKGGFFD